MKHKTRNEAQRRREAFGPTSNSPSPHPQMPKNTSVAFGPKGMGTRACAVGPSSRSTLSRARCHQAAVENRDTFVFASSILRVPRQARPVSVSQVSARSFLVGTFVPFLFRRAFTTKNSEFAVNPRVPCPCTQGRPIARTLHYWKRVRKRIFHA